MENINIRVRVKDAPASLKKRMAASLSFKDQSFKNEDFSNKKIFSFDAENCQFENCKFENLKLDDMCFGAGRKMSVYVNCSFDNSTFYSSAVGKARFENCSFQNVNIKMFFAHDAEFINCKFSGKLKKALFFGRLIDEDRRRLLLRDFNEIRDNDFSELEMDEVSFRDGVDLSKQKLPSGKGYLYLEHPEEILQRLKLMAPNLPNSLRQEVNFEIKISEEKLKDGQRQFFLIKKEMDADVFDLLVKLNLND